MQFEHLKRIFCIFQVCMFKISAGTRWPDPMRQRRGCQPRGSWARHFRRASLHGARDPEGLPAGQERQPSQTISPAVSGKEGQAEGKTTEG